MAAVDDQHLLKISGILGVSPQHLFKIVNSSDKMYTQILLDKKRSVDKRVIFIPSAELKGIQRIILRDILQVHHIHPAAYAYVKGRSVVDAAQKLCGKKSVLRIDIKDFFPSISAARVCGLFIDLGFSPTASWILTKLTTREGKLCQGSPTSPYISNLICRNLDEQMAALSVKWKCNYIRYSDDLFLFSPAGFNGEKLENICKSIVQHNGFELNANKSKYFPRNSPKILLGINVSGSRPALNQKYRKGMRAAFHKATSDYIWAIENQQKLGGMLHWYKNVYGKTDTFKLYKGVLDSILTTKKHSVYYSK